AAQLDHSHDPVEVAVAGGLHLGQQVDAAHPGPGHGRVQVDVDPDRALDPAGGVVRQLTGDVHQVAGADEGHVVGHGGGRGRQLDAEVGEAGGDAHRKAPCVP